jgi:predicted enzyme related to lactoylglutathione lyase
MTDTTASTPTGTIVWFELPSADTGRARTFYGDLFGWSFDQFGELDYHVTNQGGGAIHHDPAATGVMAYFGVADIDAAARRVTELGGSASGKQEIPGVGFYVQCSDLDGNKFGLYQNLAA